MDIFEDFGLYVVKALGLLTQWLTDLAAPIPWPVVAVLLAVPLFAVLNLIVWYFRGVVWPVRCKHPQTVKADGTACENRVRGEWRYCHHHNTYKVNSRGTTVNPNLSRWETVEKYGRGMERIVERTDIKGSSGTVNLLFHRGFARRPSKLGQAFSDIYKEWKLNIQVLIAKLKKQEIVVNKPVLDTNIKGEYDPRLAYTQRRTERADEALFILKILIPVSILLTASTVFVGGQLNAFLNYSALLALWGTFETARRGLLQPISDDEEADWRFEALKGVFKAVLGIVIVAIIGLTLDEYVFPLFEHPGGEG